MNTFANESKAPPFDTKGQARMLEHCRQLLLVTTEEWRAVTGTLRRFARDETNHGWQMVDSWPVVVGRSGLGWGIGVHGGPPAHSSDPIKQEGDGCGPAGTFTLTEAFGKASPPDAGITRFPYRPLVPTLRGVDDPDSRHYNRLVDLRDIAKPDWSSAEIMLRDDPLYDWGVVVAHNALPYHAKGSCIFLHIWRGPKVGTAGCTAMSVPHMVKLTRWLDRRKQPHLVQLPEKQYRSLRTAWQLP